MIGYAINGLYEHYKINKCLVQLKDKFSYCFYDNIKFDAFFGNFQFCIWDGGRIFDTYQHSTIEKVQEIKEFFNDQYNIPIRFIYTNSQIKEIHLTDRFCNLVTEICENELNEIVVSSPLLEDYLRTNYPKYKYISSTTKCLSTEIEAKNELQKDFYEVCLDYNLNHNFKFLESLSLDEKEKVELLVNPICGANCPNRKNHFKTNSISVLNYAKPYQLDICKISGSGLNPNTKWNRNEITPEEIYSIYTDLGIKHYKIEGRTFLPQTHICYCIKYLVKPEYQLFMIETINYLLQGEKLND